MQTDEFKITFEGDGIVNTVKIR